MRVLDKGSLIPPTFIPPFGASKNFIRVKALGGIYMVLRCKVLVLVWLGM